MTKLTEAKRNEPHRAAARLRIQNALGFLEAADAMVLEEAIALGYVPPADMHEMIQILDPLSKGMDLRYLKGEAVRLPASDEQALAVALAHRDALARQLPISDLG